VTCEEHSTSILHVWLLLSCWACANRNAVKLLRFTWYLLLFLVRVSWTTIGQPQTASSSAECSWDKPPFSFVRGQDSTMWDIVWVSSQGHRSVSVSRHFLLQAPQCLCSMQKWLSRDTVAEGGQNPVARLWGRILGGNWPPEPTSSYASINFWCQLVASPSTAASCMSVVAMVGIKYMDTHGIKSTICSCFYAVCASGL